ncbi:NAD(P)H-dependent flavin oxidoreductase [Fictibacillus fluitans]|uniref:Probable nitronate monooxygenase n=1 Tax=Fictibacillus fluitans TaxID=3058422 RepID=A0ABT8HU16_9BACL|nr:nitronate monooxygenase [Fictibacillus sp. NE201]MDN4524277.1 nitronate monooxygenase [Fictibacillus sp. NE201]
MVLPKYNRFIERREKMNRVCKLLGISYPVIQGGMGNASNAPLTAAISNAGALGTIGVGTRSPSEVETLIQETASKTDKPFAVNVPLTVASNIKEIFQLIVKYKVPVVSLSAGNPSPYISRLQSHGIKVMCVVGSVYHAKKAEDAGADVIVAEGYEAAGLNSPFETTTMTLIPQVADAITVPLVAAGGIGDGRGMAAAMVLGAEAIQLGTRFISVKEAPFHLLYKEALIKAGDRDTMVIGRSVGRIRRVMRAAYSEHLYSLENKGMTLEKFNEMTAEDRHLAGAMEGDFEEGYINSGQVAGLINDMPSASELIQSITKEALAALQAQKEKASQWQNVK